MSDHTLPEGVQQFVDRLIEMQGMMDAFFEKTESGWNGPAEFLQAARDIGKAGARVYNATTKMGGGAFELDVAIHQLKAKKQHE